MAILAGSCVRALRDHAEENALIRSEETPAKCYSESKLAQIDDGELRAEALPDVVPEMEVKVSDPGRALDLAQDGESKKNCVQVHGPKPSDTEEHKSKYDLMAVQWAVVVMKNPELVYSQDFEEDVFTGKRGILRYLVSKKVRKLKDLDKQGVESISPSWRALLGYEDELRKEACSRVPFHGDTLKVAASATVDDFMLQSLLSGHRPQREEDSARRRERWHVRRRSWKQEVLK